ncbi:MAG: hypothetical protein ACYS1A_16650 [Planctomycetota bacterium]|jgi:hypothetical protein
MIEEVIIEYLGQFGVAGVMLFIWATELRNIKVLLKDIRDQLNGSRK